MNLSDNIKEIKGIGDKTALLFEKLNIYTVRDLIFYIPRGFDLFKDPVIPTTEMAEELISVPVYFVMNSYSSTKKGHLVYTHITAKCNGKNIYLSLFNMPYLKKQLNSEELYIIRGKLEVGKQGAFSMVQPVIYKSEQYNSLCGSLQPVYSLTKGLSNRTICKSVANVIDNVSIPNDGMDGLSSIKMTFGEALKTMHFPNDYDSFVKARERIVFHEFLSFLLQMKTEINESATLEFNNPLIETADTQRLLEALPYSLTKAQQRVWEEIKADMSSSKCMNRMIQGDVGSGKTILAFLALLMNAANNRQGVLMAPTEVLAKQHFENLEKLVERFNLPINPVLLLGSMTAKDKRENYSLIENGLCNVIIGTHAVFQDKVIYKDLTLVITDEQHRFGVNQREALANKSKAAHLLVMSATPIPRSLAMILYGNVSLSLLDEMPQNRLPIKSCIINSSKRKTAFNFITKELEAGHQAYIVCPQIEDNSGMDLENVTDYTQKLKDIFPPKYNISLIHGKMSLAQKNEIMDDFKNHNIDILVSTTVIEVGIDVANATVIMIENSERFGLAALHQLRGRVGRGADQSYCIFITSKNDERTGKRLDVLIKTNNGFEIADEDLRLRGPGDLFGIRQSGDFGFYVGDIYNDSKILQEAHLACDSLLEEKNSLKLANLLKCINDTSFNSVDFRTI